MGMRYSVICKEASHKTYPDGSPLNLKNAVWLADSIARTSDWVEVVQYWDDENGDEQSEVVYER